MSNMRQKSKIYSALAILEKLHLQQVSDQFDAELANEDVTSPPISNDNLNTSSSSSNGIRSQTILRSPY